MLIDPVERKLTLYPADYVPSGNEWTGESLYLVDGNHFAVNAALLNNIGELVQVKLKVDTGSSEFIHLFPQSDWEESIRTNKKRKRTGGFGADSTLVYNLRGKVKQMKLAGQSFRNVPAIFVSDTINLKAVDGSNAQGLVGQGILMKYHILYRYADREAFFQTIR